MQINFEVNSKQQEIQVILHNILYQNLDLDQRKTYRFEILYLMCIDLDKEIQNIYGESKEKLVWIRCMAFCTVFFWYIVVGWN